MISTCWGQANNPHFDGTQTDWSILSGWSIKNSPVDNPLPDPLVVPGTAGALGVNVTFGTTQLTGVRTVNLNGNYTVGTLATANLTDLLTLQGGGTNRTLTLNSGISHTRGGLTLGSVTDGQKVNILLGGSQNWTSSTAGTGTLQAAFILNDVSIGSGGNQTLTLTGTNTGTKIDGSIGNGAATLSLAKSGTGTWTINGPAAYSGSTTVSAGTLVINGAASYSGPTTVSAGTLRLNSTAGLNTNLVTLSANTTLGLAVGGTTGMPNAKLASLISTGTFPATSTLELNTTGPVFLPTTNPLQANFSKAGTFELALSGVSSRTTTTAISAGILRLRDLQSGGVPSPIGASTSDANNFRFASGTRLIYDGPATTSDRLLNLAGTFSLESAGSGPLKLSNTGTHPGSTGARTVVLLGSNQGDNLIAGALGARTDSAITKRGNGSWRITGTQPVMTGTTTYRVEEGELTFDFSTGNDPFSPVTLLLNGGKTILRGNGATTKTISSLNLGSTIISAFHFRLENGFALTASTMTGNSTQRNDLIDLSAGANNSLTVNGLSGSTIANVNGVIMIGASPNGRASTVLRATDGSYGFFALSNGTSGTAQKAGPLTERTPGSLAMTSNTTNYLLKAGTYIGSGNLDFSTAALDTTNGPITLDIGAGKVRPSGQGKALLFSGPNSVSIEGNIDNNAAGEDNAIWFHNYLEYPAKLNLDVGLGDTSQTVIFGGTGTTEYSGQGFVGTFDVNDGVFRFTAPQTIPLNELSPNFKIGSGAVLEIGERLQDETVTPAHLVKTVGNDVRVVPPVTPPGNIRLYGDAGLSAWSAIPGQKRIAYFSYITADEFSGQPILTPQPLIWGSNFFLTVSETENNVDGDNSFMLSSPTSNAMLEIQNTINLNGRSRTVDVANGSDPIDARLSGTLTGDAAAGIVKRGPGTLQLTGVNFYKGETRVMEGTLMIDSASLDAQSRLSIDSGATLQILSTSTVHVSSVFIDGVQYFGTITHPSITGGGTLISDAALTPYAQWVVDKALSTPQSAPSFDADSDGLRNLLEYAVGSEPKTPNGSVFAITGSAPRQIKFNHPSGRTDIMIYLDASPTLAAPWTTIATSTAGAAFTNSVANVTVSEVSNQVTVTDSRTPAATVMFYRLRAEK